MKNEKELSDERGVVKDKVSSVTREEETPVYFIQRGYRGGGEGGIYNILLLTERNDGVSSNFS